MSIITKIEKINEIQRTYAVCCKSVNNKVMAYLSYL